MQVAAEKPIEEEHLIKLPWREAGPPNHHDDKVDSDQLVVNKELSLSGVQVAAEKPIEEEHLIMEAIQLAQSRHFDGCVHLLSMLTRNVAFCRNRR